MANPPPPYENLTGISRTVMKDNAQETVTNYNGNARPAEHTVNVNTNEIYIGNCTGALTKIVQVTGANTFLGNVREVTGGVAPAGFSPVYYNPTTGELIVVTP